MFSAFVLILTILGSVSSTLCALREFSKDRNRPVRKFWVSGFVIAFVLCLFALLVPGNPLARNVESKLEYFSKSMDYSPETLTMVQSGTFSVNKPNTKYSIEFSPPFNEIPEVDIISKSGKASPNIVEISKSQVIVQSTGGSSDEGNFRWKATGAPLYPVEIKEVKEP